MDTVGSIVRARREALGLTLAAVAAEAGLTKGYLSMIENQRLTGPPSPDALAGLERALSIQTGELRRAADWQKTPTHVQRQVGLLADAARSGEDLARWLKEATQKRGDGARGLDKLYRTGELTRRVNQTLRATGDAAEQASGKSGDAPGAEQSLDPRIPVRYQVPLINKVAAGYPRDFTDLDYPARVADEYIPCPDLTDPAAFAARVVGDSMLPDYREGDVVVFSPRQKITHGADCFVRLEPDHQTTFKRVFFDEGSPEESATVRLQPLNARYAAVTVERDQVAGIYKAVWRFQRLG